MRTKEEIMKDTIKGKSATPHWDTTATIHERLTIEVLIDIRDALITDCKDAMNALIEIRKTH